MSELNDSRHQTSQDELQREIERLETAPWRAPRGPKTKFFAWVIVIGVALCLLAMIVILALEWTGVV